MSHHDELGLLVYIDAQPDEQLQRSSLTLCLTALVCDQDPGLVDLKQFKDTPISDRISEANRLEAAIRTGEITVRVTQWRPGGFSNDLVRRGAKSNWTTRSEVGEVNGIRQGRVDLSENTLMLNVELGNPRTI